MPERELADHSLFTVPNVNDGFTTIEQKTAEEFIEGFLKKIRTAHEYAHGVVGSRTLAKFYEGFGEVYDLWGAKAETAGRQAVAVSSRVNNSNHFAIGSIRRAQSKGSHPQAVFSSFETPGGQLDVLNFVLWLNLGEVATVQVISDEKDKARMTRHNDPQSVLPYILEETIWAKEADQDRYSVLRYTGACQVAFGQRAMRLLPGFKQSELAAVTQDLALTRYADGN